ncbi:phenylalanyl-tRNA synthetase subunit alpha [Stappia sp.]|uniref:phenylalanyl-tRNA synthetase subunit alpha n=1 Tax=Stappia sp. TaxID=1870903 RepID=UPI0032D9322C
MSARPTYTGRRLSGLAVLLGALLLALLAVPGAPSAVAQTPAQPQSFLEVCAEKSAERGRLRYCDDYFRDALGPAADPVLYLRDRITSLRASQEASAAENYESFLTAVAIVAFLSIATMILVVSERRITGIAKWSSATATAALLVIIATMTMGWLEKYRAEDAAMLELGLLRDQIETEAAQVIASGGEIDAALLRRWNDRLHEIGLRFARNYGSSSPIPDLDRFQPSD